MTALAIPLTQGSMDAPQRPRTPMGRVIRGPKPISVMKSVGPSETSQDDSKKARKKYLKYMDRRPRWAARFLGWMSNKGALDTRFMDGRFWMARAAGFRPLLDEHWEWWLKSRWESQLFFYEQGIEWRAINRHIRHKGNPEAHFEKLQANSGR